MEKKALIGKIIFLLLLAVFVIAIVVYLFGGLKYTTRGVTATVSYNPEEDAEGIEIIELPPTSPPPSPRIENNETNLTEPELIAENGTGLNFTEISG